MVRKLARLLAKACLLALLILIGTPLLLSLGLGAALLEAAARPVFGDAFSVGRVALDHSGSLTATGLRVAGPKQSGPLLEVDRVRLDLRLARLLAGRLDLELEIHGVRARIPSGRFGPRSLEAAVRAWAEAPDQDAGPRERAGRSRIERLLVEVREGELRVLDRDGALEARFEFEAVIASGAPKQPLSIEATCRAFPPAGAASGALRLSGTLDAPCETLDLLLEGQRLDLAAWQVAWGISPLSAGLSGSVDTRLEARVDPAWVRLEGELEALDLALRLCALGAVPLRQERWRLNGRAAFDRKTGTVDLAELEGDFGPLKLQGLPRDRCAALLATEGPAIGLEATFDLSAVPPHPALFPRGASASGVLAMEAARSAGRTVGVLSGRGLEWNTSGPRAGPMALEVTFEAEQGRAHLTLALEGEGTATGKLALDLLASGLPASAELRLDDFPIDAAMAPALAFLAPFAITPDSQLQGRLALRAEGAGALEGALEAGVGQLLTRWQGRLDYDFFELHSSASPALAPLLGPFGAGSRFFFPRLSGSARLADGALVQETIRIETADASILSSGTTTLAGGLDYRFDCSPLLQRHSGRELLAALGSSNLPAGLGGSLERPLAMVEAVDLQQLLGPEPPDPAAPTSEPREDNAR